MLGSLLLPRHKKLKEMLSLKLAKNDFELGKLQRKHLGQEEKVAREVEMEVRKVEAPSVPCF